MRISNCPAAVNSIMALKQRGHCPPKDEKALESGAKSEDQPDMETSRGSRCKSTRHNSFLSMVYVGIVAAEFVVATVGVAFLIRYYNHKA